MSDFGRSPYEPRSYLYLRRTKCMILLDTFSVDTDCHKISSLSIFIGRNFSQGRFGCSVFVLSYYFIHTYFILLPLLPIRLNQNGARKRNTAERKALWVFERHSREFAQCSVATCSFSHFGYSGDFSFCFVFLLVPAKEKENPLSRTDRREPTPSP